MPRRRRIAMTTQALLAAVALASGALLGCGDGDRGSASRDLCAGVDATELEDIWGDVSASEVGGLCSIIVADGESIFLEGARATGSEGQAELLEGVIGADKGEPVDVGDEGLVFVGTSAGDVFVARVGENWFKVSAVGLPLGQLEATARSIAENL